MFIRVFSVYYSYQCVIELNLSLQPLFKTFFYNLDDLFMYTSYMSSLPISLRFSHPTSMTAWLRLFFLLAFFLLHFFVFIKHGKVSVVVKEFTLFLWLSSHALRNRGHGTFQRQGCSIIYTCAMKIPTVQVLLSCLYFTAFNSMSGLYTHKKNLFLFLGVGESGSGQEGEGGSFSYFHHNSGIQGFKYKHYPTSQYAVQYMLFTAHMEILICGKRQGKNKHNGNTTLINLVANTDVIKKTAIKSTQSIWHIVGHT